MNILHLPLFIQCFFFKIFSKNVFLIKCSKLVKCSNIILLFFTSNLSYLSPYTSKFSNRFGFVTTLP